MILKYSKSTYLLLFFSISFQLVSCAQRAARKKVQSNDTIAKPIKTGASRIDLYLDLLKNKKIAIVANQTSVIEKLQRKEVASNVMGSKLITQHLVDFLHSDTRITVKRVFAPEHGFRGDADAGEIVKNGVDPKTGIPIVSLYGKNKKPHPEQLKDVDLVVFDIQDVGARFYTYISTLHYVMEACAEENIPVILLDRPNPNAHYIDGPVLDMKYKSFVGMHPVPVVYGMTIGEYSTMINGEKWLKNGVQCNLKIIPLENYTHSSAYSLAIKPSPNLPNDTAINLYPSLCFFEGTDISVGRGTSHQFQVVGTPFYHLKRYTYQFTPVSNEGAKYPIHQNKKCYGYDLTNYETLNKLELKWLLDFYEAYKNHVKENKFFNTFFVNLSGTETLEQQIKKGLSPDEIRNSWQKKIQEFRLVRAKYLLYK